jgi:dipeptidyl aminopeptidase/acylaminoacyl peptidase
MERKFKSLQITLSAMIILAFLAMPFTTYAQAGKANFSGSWVYNAEKSQPNQGQPPQGQGQQPQGQGQGQGQRGFGGGNFVVKQEANLLTVERTRTGQDGQPTTTTAKYTLDGKESVNTSGMGETKSVATWSADGKTLIIVSNRTFERDGQTTTMKTTEEYTLTSPTLLSIKSTRTSPNGDRVSTLVYDKK